MDVALTSCSLVRAGASVVTAGLRSAKALSSGVEFGSVAWPVEDFDFVLVLGQPRLDRLAMMDSQAIENQKHLLV